MRDTDARKLLIEIVTDLFAHGHLTPTGGNVSIKSSDENLIWITPSQMYKGALTADDLCLVDRNGTVVEGGPKPSVEYQMHWGSYDARPEATGSVHTHSPAATAFGITNQTFPAFNTDAIFLADTQIVPWFMPGSKELADAVTDALKVSRGAILQCHGLMAAGKTLRDASTRAMMIEETARLFLYCKQFGGEITCIPPEWVENLRGIANFL